MAQITTPKTHIKYAKAKEKQGQFEVAADAYEKGKDTESLVRLCLEHLQLRQLRQLPLPSSLPSRSRRRATTSRRKRCCWRPSRTWRAKTFLFLGLLVSPRVSTSDYFLVVFLNRLFSPSLSFPPSNSLPFTLLSSLSPPSPSPPYLVEKERLLLLKALGALALDENDPNHAQVCIPMLQLLCCCCPYRCLPNAPFPHLSHAGLLRRCIAMHVDSSLPRRCQSSSRIWTGRPVLFEQSTACSGRLCTHFSEARQNS
jgi:hypothetical protein